MTLPTLTTPTIDRRALLLGAGALAVLAALPLPSALAQGAGETFPAEELAQAGPLGDRPLGSPTAPVTFYEYASLTCGHCAAFHAEGFKHLKARYIDTGRVRYILREFPLDPIALAGFMLAHCAGENRFHPMVDLIFAQQRQLLSTDRPADALLGIVRQAGFTQESFEACLRDQRLYEGLNAVRQRGVERFRINATPTFFINGRKYTGVLTAQEIDRILEPLLRA